MRGDFLEPERNGGVMVWALRQLMFWLVGGIAIYLIVVGLVGLFGNGHFLH